MREGINGLFELHGFLLIPALVVIVGSLMKKNPLIVLFTSSLTAMILAFLFQGVSLQSIFSSGVSGFEVTMLGNEAVIDEEMKSLLNRGGLYSMYNATFFVFVAFFFASALEISQALTIVLERIISRLKTIGSITFAALLTGFAVINFTSNALVSYFLIQDIYGKVYKSKNMHPVNLSRNMEDSITITEVLMPWTVSGVFMATTLGVGNFEFLPWAIFNLGGFIFSALYGFLAPYTGGFGIRKLEQTEADQDAAKKASL